MKKFAYLLLLVGVIACTDKPETSDEVKKWLSQAENVTIIRDTYGVPHIFGKSDADAVFGLLYAQCEDDFNRVEMNFINAMGRLAEVEGESEIYRDLRMKMYIDTVEIKNLYNDSPQWLKTLMVAWADGINYYLYKNPQTKPKLLTRFEPWMALTFSEGSIGGDIESISTRDLKAFYGDSKELSLSNYEQLDQEPRGSNGFAIAPKNTVNGKALFGINPHTSFFFRPEVHVVSEEGLYAYGAVTWGQMFVYQGFNKNVGWMHTSTKADVIDEYLETVIENDGEFYYQYGTDLRPFTTKEITIPYKTESGMSTKVITAYFTHRGPVIRKEGDKWVSIELMENPLNALNQSFSRTKATDYDSFYKTMKLRTNSSNNTVYADKDGNIAYFHGNFMPKRDPNFDYSGTVDGSNPAIDWNGLHDLDEMIIVKNPENGWLQNCNATPFTVAGDFSPKKEDYPTYMAPDLESFRGIHAIKVLKDKTDFTLEGLIAAAYDPLLTGFELMIPPLLESYQSIPKTSTSKNTKLDSAITLLGYWDYKYSKTSFETTLAVFWAQELMTNLREKNLGEALDIYDYMTNYASVEERIDALSGAIALLEADFGSWQVAWGEVNRYQRINGDIIQKFDDNAPSLAVGFASSRWGSLASFGSRRYEGTKKMYGTSGNSFVAFVEFGDTIRAKSILAGGISGDPSSPHFDDQAQMYADEQFKEVLFYEADIKKNAKKTYQP